MISLHQSFEKKSSFTPSQEGFYTKKLTMMTNSHNPGQSTNDNSSPLNTLTSNLPGMSTQEKTDYVFDKLRNVLFWVTLASLGILYLFSLRGWISIQMRDKIIGYTKINKMPVQIGKCSRGFIINKNIMQLKSNHLYEILIKEIKNFEAIPWFKT